MFFTPSVPIRTAANHPFLLLVLAHFLPINLSLAVLFPYFVSSIYSPPTFSTMAPSPSRPTNRPADWAPSPSCARPLKTARKPYTHPDYLPEEDTSTLRSRLSDAERALATMTQDLANAQAENSILLSRVDFLEMVDEADKLYRDAMDVRIRGNQSLHARAEDEARTTIIRLRSTFADFHPLPLIQEAINYWVDEKLCRDRSIWSSAARHSLKAASSR